MALSEERLPTSLSTQKMLWSHKRRSSGLRVSQAQKVLIEGCTYCFSISCFILDAYFSLLECLPAVGQLP